MKTDTTFRSGVDLVSSSFEGIEVKTTGNVSAATGLINQKVPATLTSSKKVEQLIDIDSVKRATNALGLIDQGVDLISNTRSRLGSYMNTLTHASDSLVNISTNLTASKSQILDADYSSETTNLASSQIVQQAGREFPLSKHQEESKVSLNILDSKKIKRYHKSLSNLTPADIYFVSG